MTIARTGLIFLSLALGACANYAPAPVVERGSTVPATAPAIPVTAGMYTVKKGDTLYSIALDHGQDYKDIAAWNNLDNPSLIKIGQTLRVTPPEGSAPVAVAKPVSSSAPIEVSSIAGGDASSNLPDNTDTLKREPKGGTVAYSESAWAAAQQGVSGEKPTVVATPEPVAPVSATPEKPAVTGNDVEWQWPANGKLLASFAEGGSKGMDVAGKTGDAVQAAADGVVSYAGSGLRGYGNLVVIRHNATWLSVNAHNTKILFK
jgi:lipoprotein NlpD